MLRCSAVNCHSSPEALRDDPNAFIDYSGHLFCQRCADHVAAASQPKIRCRFCSPFLVIRRLTRIFVNGNIWAMEGVDDLVPFSALDVNSLTANQRTIYEIRQQLFSIFEEERLKDRRLNSKFLLSTEETKLVNRKTDLVSIEREIYEYKEKCKAKKTEIKEKKKEIANLQALLKNAEPSKRKRVRFDDEEYKVTKRRKLN